MDDINANTNDLNINDTNETETTTQTLSVTEVKVDRNRNKNWRAGIGDNYKNKTPEEKFEFHSIGGKAHQAKRRRAKTFKEAAVWLASLPAFENTNEAVNALLAAYPDLNNAEAMTVALISKTLNEGDARAYTTVRDTTGELPAQTVNVQNAEPMTITIKTV